MESISWKMMVDATNAAVRPFVALADVVMEPSSEVSLVRNEERVGAFRSHPCARSIPEGVGNGPVSGIAKAIRLYRRVFERGATSSTSRTSMARGMQGGPGGAFPSLSGRPPHWNPDQVRPGRIEAGLTATPRPHRAQHIIGECAKSLRSPRLDPPTWTTCPIRTFAIKTLGRHH